MNRKFIGITTNMHDRETKTIINVDDICSCYPSFRWDKKQKGYRPAIFFFTKSQKTFFTTNGELFSSKKEALETARRWFREHIQQLEISNNLLWV